MRNFQKIYIDLQQKVCNTPSFYINYKHSFPNLPSSNLYTGYCFSESSATIMLVDAGDDVATLKRCMVDGNSQQLPEVI